MDRIQELTIEELRYVDKMVLRHTKCAIVRDYSDDKFLDFVYTITEAYVLWLLGSSKQARLEAISRLC